MIEIRHRQSGCVLLQLDQESLAGADLSNAHLRGANLRGADLRGANLRGARLDDADLAGADLRDAILVCAHLRRADLSGSDLSGANFRHVEVGPGPRGKTFAACLDDSMLWGANLAGARYDARTHWPPGLDPKQRGCVGSSEVTPAAAPDGSGSEAAPAPEPEARVASSPAAEARGAVARAKRWEPVLARTLAEPARPHACPFCGEEAVRASWAVFSRHRLASVDIWCDACGQRMHCACRLDEVAPGAADSYPPGAVHPTAETARQISQVGRQRGWW